MVLHSLKIFYVKKERSDITGYRAQDFSIAGRIFYHLNYKGSTNLSNRNYLRLIRVRIYREAIPNLSRSF